MRSRPVACALIAVLLGFAESAIAANPLKGIRVIDANEHITGGAIDINRFAVQKGKLVAISTLRGAVADQQIKQPVIVSVGIDAATCEALNLQLGPVSLSLDDRRIQLSQVSLDVSAKQSTGVLIGDLLCSIEKLLKDKAPQTAIAQKLNQVLRALG
jgi:hypothetical protein